MKKEYILYWQIPVNILKNVSFEDLLKPITQPLIT